MKKETIRTYARKFFVWLTSPQGSPRDRDIEHAHQLHARADRLERYMDELDSESPEYREFARRCAEHRGKAARIGNRYGVPELVAAAY